LTSAPERTWRRYRRGPAADLRPYQRACHPCRCADRSVLPSRWPQAAAHREAVFESQLVGPMAGVL